MNKLEEIIEDLVKGVLCYDEGLHEDLKSEAYNKIISLKEWKENE